MTVIATPRRLVPLLLAVLVTTSTPAGTTAAASATQTMAEANTTRDALDQQMLELMNSARASVGAPPLTASPGLRDLALSWSNNMANGGTKGLEHNPNVRALLPNHGAASATGWAENVANWSPGNGRDAAGVFDLYMNSPSHRANILNPAMRFVGIGTVISGSDVGWNTQNFTDKIDRAANPIGSFDTATVLGSNVYVAGWALEPADKTRQIPVHIYINNPAGTAGTPLTTTSYRPDVNNALGATGNHGYAATLPLPTGTSNICAYAISTLGAGNTLIACQTVNRPATVPPVGSFDTATVLGSNVYVAGWALEPADKTRQIPVHIYINNPAGTVGTPLTTTSYRPDVNNALGATGNHGYAATLPLPTGTSNICAYAISTLGAGNTLIACQTVNRPATVPPVGSFDTATVLGSNIYVAGWALEPADKTRQIPVHIYINNPAGTVGTPLTTTSYRPDVNNALGATGNHGYAATLPLPTGTSNICAYAISTFGVDNVLLACRTVSR